MERGRGWGQMIGGICLNKKIIHQQKVGFKKLDSTR
jgi:hypothetical protein